MKSRHFLAVTKADNVNALAELGRQHAAEKSLLSLKEQAKYGKPDGTANLAYHETFNRIEKGIQRGELVVTRKAPVSQETIYDYLMPY